MSMTTTNRSSRGFVEDTVRRMALAHAEHHKGAGEAHVQGANTLVEQDGASEKQGTSFQDLPGNIAQAANELHRSLLTVPRRVLDVLGAADDTTKDTAVPASGKGSAGKGSAAEPKSDLR